MVLAGRQLSTARGGAATLSYWLLVGALVATSVFLHRTGVARFDLDLHWTAWLVAGLVLLVGGWMAFDGGRALLLGDYVTPRSGPFAGTLGPWSRVVEAVGIPARSTAMKGILLGYGLGYVAVAAAWLFGASRGRRAVLVAAALGLWYLPFGTLANAGVIGLLLLAGPRRR